MLLLVKGILKSFLESLSENELKEVAVYEYSNKTEVSVSSDIFNKYCSKYSNLVNEVDEEETLELTMEIDKYNEVTKEKGKKGIIIPLIIVFVILFSALFVYIWNEDNKLLEKYKGVMYPGIYLNSISLEKMSYEDVEKLVTDEKEKIENGKLTITNINGEYSYSYKDIGVEVNDSIKEEIINYNRTISRFKKLSMIKNKNKKYKVFKLEGSFSDEVMDKFIVTLKDKLNTDAKEDSFTVNNNPEVYYDAGTNGFVLDADKTKSKIVDALAKLSAEIKVEAEGTVTKAELKYTKYKDINKKIATFTTYFANAGNRGHNIVLAASKLNEKLVEPGETFSYIKTVGPFSNGSGYLPAPVYLNNDVASGNGGGVCQLATTLYVTLLQSNLTIVQRQGHSFAPTYVKGGLDATIYSPSVDLKFKNEYEYPIFIVSYVRGNYLTVDLWTSDKTLGNKTYEPYSVYSNGGYLTYVKEFEDGKYISQRYLNKTTYKPHP